MNLHLNCLGRMRSYSYIHLYAGLDFCLTSYFYANSYSYLDGPTYLYSYRLSNLQPYCSSSLHVYVNMYVYEDVGQKLELRRTLVLILVLILVLYLLLYVRGRGRV